MTEQLVLTRRGTAYFAQRLSFVSDAQLEGPSLLNGWSRRELVAHVGYNAAALCHLVEWAATGVESPMYSTPEERARQIEQGATLNPAALRNLVTHTIARLDKLWRDLASDEWHHLVRTAQGREVPVAETVWMRAREVWIHAVDLDNGGRFGDMPSQVLVSLLDDVVSVWRTRSVGLDLVLRPENFESFSVATGGAAGTVDVRGSLADVARWSTGRSGAAVTNGVSSELPSPPVWI